MRILCQNPDSATVVPGSIYPVNSDFQSVRIIVQASQLKSALSDTSVVLLDKIGMSGVSTVFAFSNGAMANIAPGTIFHLFGNMKNQIVEFSDMPFTSIGPFPGLVMVEWDVAVSKTGSVGM